MNMSNLSAAGGAGQPTNYTTAPHNNNTTTTNDTGGINSGTAGHRQFNNNTLSTTLPPNDNSTSSTTMNQHHHDQHQQQQQSSMDHVQPTTAMMMMMPDNVGSSILGEFENETISNYNPPGIPPMNRSTMTNVGSNASNNIASGNANTSSNNNKHVQWVHNPSDGSVLQDHRGKPISVDRMLATKPLKDELSTRKGPGNKSLTYMSGDGVSRTLNDIFGYDGWNFDIKKVEQVGKNYDKSKDRYEVVYCAHVRVTDSRSGSYREDIGTGDSIDKSYATAVGHAIKGSVTDALKRSARHFGDKLGGALYGGNFTKKNAPTTLKDALDKYEIERANSKFGFPKDQQKAASIVASEAAATAAATNNSSYTTVNSINHNSQNLQQKIQNQSYHHQQKQSHHHHHQQQQLAKSAVEPAGTNMNKPANGLSHSSAQNPVYSASTSGLNDGKTTNGPTTATSYNGNAPSRPSLPQIPQQQQPKAQTQTKYQHQPQHRQYQENNQIIPPAQNQSQIPQAQATISTPAARPPHQPQQQSQASTSRPQSRYGRVGSGVGAGRNGLSVAETTTNRQNPYGNSHASSTTSGPNAQSSSISSNPKQHQHQLQNQYRPPLSLQTNTNQLSGTGPTVAAGTGQDKSSINSNMNMTSKRPAQSSNAVNNPYQSNSKIGRYSM